MGRAPGMRAIAPRENDTQVYKQLHSLLRIDEAGESLYPTECDTLYSLASIKLAAERMIVRAIDDARAAGIGWEPIGQSLGMTRQGAQFIAQRAGAVDL